MKTLLAALALLFASVAPAWAAMPPEQAAAFRKDLDHLAIELPKRHANLFHTTPRKDFDAEVTRLLASVPGWRFVPAVRLGSPHPVWVSLDFYFNPE